MICSCDSIYRGGDCPFGTGCPNRSLSIYENDNQFTIRTSSAPIFTPVRKPGDTPVSILLDVISRLRDRSKAQSGTTTPTTPGTTTPALPAKLSWLRVADGECTAQPIPIIVITVSQLGRRATDGFVEIKADISLSDSSITSWSVSTSGGYTFVNAGQSTAITLTTASGTLKDNYSFRVRSEGAGGSALYEVSINPITGEAVRSRIGGYGARPAGCAFNRWRLNLPTGINLISANLGVSGDLSLNQVSSGIYEIRGYTGLVTGTATVGNGINQVTVPVDKLRAEGNGELIVGESTTTPTVQLTTYNSPITATTDNPGVTLVIARPVPTALLTQPTWKLGAQSVSGSSLTRLFTAAGQAGIQFSSVNGDVTSSVAVSPPTIPTNPTDPTGPIETGGPTIVKPQAICSPGNFRVVTGSAQSFLLPALFLGTAPAYSIKAQDGTALDAAQYSLQVIADDVVTNGNLVQRKGLYLNVSANAAGVVGIRLTATNKSGSDYVDFPVTAIAPASLGIRTAILSQSTLASSSSTGTLRFRLSRTASIKLTGQSSCDGAVTIASVTATALGSPSGGYTHEIVFSSVSSRLYLAEITDASGVETLSVSMPVKNGEAALTAAPVNTAPVVKNPIPDQTAPVGQAFSYTIPVDTFGDVETSSLSIGVSGLPTTLSYASGKITGTPTEAFSGTIRVTATDEGGLSVYDEFILIVSVPLKITGVRLFERAIISATERRLKLSPQYAGATGKPITFSIVGLVGNTTSPGPYTFQIFTDNPVITLQATQEGTPGVATLSYNWNSATVEPLDSISSIVRRYDANDKSLYYLVRMAQYATNDNTHPVYRAKNASESTWRSAFTDTPVNAATAFPVENGQGYHYYAKFNLALTGEPTTNTIVQWKRSIDAPDSEIIELTYALPAQSEASKEVYPAPVTGTPPAGSNTYSGQNVSDAGSTDESIMKLESYTDANGMVGVREKSPGNGQGPRWYRLPGRDGNGANGAYYTQAQMEADRWPQGRHLIFFCQIMDGVPSDTKHRDGPYHAEQRITYL